MNMNKMLLAIGLAVSIAAGPTFAKTAPKWLIAAGGEVEKRTSEDGVFVFANAQKRVPSSVITPIAEELREFLMLAIDVRDIEGTVSVSNASKRLRDMNASAAVFVVDDPTLPTTVLAAPESGWAILNVAALAADGSKGRWLTERVKKEIWRSFGYVNGAGEADCMMHPIFSLKQLDSLQAGGISPEPLGKIAWHLGVLGMREIRRGTYLTACEEGWAPAPTNDVQKTIWDKVHQLPTNPLPLVKPAK